MMEAFALMHGSDMSGSSSLTSQRGTASSHLRRLSFPLLAALLSFPLILPAQGALDITLESLAGSRTTLRAVCDSPLTYVMFWATWCEPCQTELRNISRKYAPFRDKGICVVAVCVDDVRSVGRARTFARQRKFGFPVLFDPESRLLKELNAQSIPFGAWLTDKGNVLLSRSGYLIGDEDLLEEDFLRLSKNFREAGREQ
jgi:peroxiredoxin